MKINIFTTTLLSPNSRAFYAPILAAKPFLKEFEIKLFWKISHSLLECDALFVDACAAAKFAEEQITEMMKNARLHGTRILWFDTTDASECLGWKYLPYVDGIYKSHLLKNRKKYLEPTKTGILFVDYFDSFYHSSTRTVARELPREEDLEKLHLSWAPCYEVYDSRQYSPFRKLRRALEPYLGNILPRKFPLQFTPPGKKRDVIISARFHKEYPMKAIGDHRKAVATLLSECEADCSKVDIQKYYEEMRNARLTVSPFGNGEFCFRDYEAFASGSCLMKPDMSHFETWPELYIPEKTFIPFRWDLSDLKEKTKYYLNHEDERIRIASEAQNNYRKILSENGIRLFAERFRKMFLT